MINKLLIATHNYGKFKEIESALKDLPLKTYNLNDLKIKDDVLETGQTYEENAIIKAKFFQQIAQMPTLADDSGIEIEALKNELGVKTRRWGAGENASDQEWLDYFLKRMSQEKNKKACFFTTLAFLKDANSKAQIFIGKCHGIITAKIEADYLPGIPLSATFKPKGLDKVYSALSPAEKNKISHRGKASYLFRDYLTN